MHSRKPSRIRAVGTGSQCPVHRNAQAAGGVNYVPAEPGDYVGIEEPTAERNNRILFDEIEYLIYERRNPWDTAPELERPPAGYTYLGQLAAHDLTHNSLTKHDADPLSAAVNLRVRPLLLDSLYGPIDTECAPWFSRFDAAGLRLPDDWPGTRFVLDTVARRHPPEPGIRPAAPTRDIGRTETLADAAGRRPDASELCGWNGIGSPVGVALVADPRNDDQPMLSQLTALLQWAHNLAMDELEQGRRPPDRRTSEENFATARAALTYVYREILKSDFLRKLLDPDVFAHYDQSDPAYLDQPSDGAVVSRDFAHAAFRFGHAMVRTRYTFNKNEHGEDSLASAFEKTSQADIEELGTNDHVPLSQHWIINWSRFFEVNGSTPQKARAIMPFNNPSLVDVEEEAEGGRKKTRKTMMRLDLARSDEFGVRSIPTILRQIRSRMPELANSSEWLGSDERWQTVMRTWWGDQEHAPTPREPVWIGAELSVNPPPFLYYLVEALVSHRGARLGPLGSIVIADTFFRAFTDFPIPSDTSDMSAEHAAQRIFGPQPPTDMPTLVNWVNDRLPDGHKRLDGDATGGGAVELPLADQR